MAASLVEAAFPLPLDIIEMDNGLIVESMVYSLIVLDISTREEKKVTSKRWAPNRPPAIWGKTRMPSQL